MENRSVQPLDFFFRNYFKNSFRYLQLFLGIFSVIPLEISQSISLGIPTAISARNFLEIPSAMLLYIPTVICTGIISVLTLGISPESHLKFLCLILLNFFLRISLEYYFDNCIGNFSKIYYYYTKISSQISSVTDLKSFPAISMGTFSVIIFDFF